MDSEKKKKKKKKNGLRKKKKKVHYNLWVCKNVYETEKEKKKQSIQKTKHF